MSTSALLVTIAASVLLWTWIVYPIVVWCLSRLRSVAPRGTPATWPSVTAILATRDEPAMIAARVADFLAADYPPESLDVVVGVDRATPEQIDVITKACNSTRVRIVSGDPAGGKVAGLNAAVREATGAVLVFSDVQQRFAPDAIRLLVTQLVAAPQLGAIGGALQLPGDMPGAGGRSPVEWYWAMERQLRAAEARLHSSVGLSGSIYATWRATWEPMPTQLILDDVWLPMQVVLRGQRVGYALDAKAWDARSTTAAAEKVRKVRTLTGNFQLVAWLPGVLVPFRNPIWLQFVSHKLLRLLTPWLLLACVVGSTGLLLEWIGREAMLQVVGALAAVCAAVLVWPSTRTRFLRLMGWGWSLQVALVEATMNGVRGRWDVWR